LDLYKKFLVFIDQQDLFKQTEKIIVGVSGGPDSLTLLDLFYHYQKENNLKIIVAHLDHQIRSTSADEAKFVEEKAREYGFLFQKKVVNLPALHKNNSKSMEQLAREVRLDFFRILAKKHSTEIVALGHHQDDLVETVLLHLFRGSGLQGLRGIEPASQLNNLVIIHPLLDIKRKEIENYCNKIGLKPKFDLSNEENLYTRNKIRNIILPTIRSEINPKVDTAVYKLANIIKEEDDYLEKLAIEKLKSLIISRDHKKLVLDYQSLVNTDFVILKRILRRIFMMILGNKDDLYFDHINYMVDYLAEAKTGTGIDLPSKIRLHRNYEEIIIEQQKGSSQSNDYHFVLHLGEKVCIKDKYIVSFDQVESDLNFEEIQVKNYCYFDIDKIELPIQVRNRRRGDTFQPLGMQGNKKLKDYFIDQKIPVYKRDEIPIILDRLERIVWIAGQRMDNKFKLRANTENIGKLNVEYLKEDNYE